MRTVSLKTLMVAVLSTSATALGGCQVSPETAPLQQSATSIEQVGVGTRAELPTCDAASESKVLFVRDENKLAVCMSGVWEQVSLPPGPSGATGETGAKGDPGAKGDVGAQGVAGTAGAAAAVGDTGAAGPKGEIGAAGAKGDKGDKGDNGAIGATSLLSVTILAVDDTHCAAGGLKIDVGIDDDRSGTLEAGEIDGTTYACHAVKRKRVAFTTSQTFDGNLGGLAGGDAKCQAAANGVPALAGKTFRAWLSDASSDPASTFTTDGSFVTVSGAALADSFSDFRDGALASPIATQDDGPPSAFVWTGTDTNGRRVGDNCSGWTTTQGSGVYGDPSPVNANWGWSYWWDQSCSEVGALFCIEQ